MHLSIHATGATEVPQAERHGVSGRNVLPETETNVSFGRTLLDKLGPYPEQTSASIAAADDGAVAGTSSKETSEIERAAGGEPNAERQALISSKALSAQTPAADTPAAGSARSAPLPESAEATNAGSGNASFPDGTVPESAAGKVVPESAEGEANGQESEALSATPSTVTARAGAKSDAKSVEESGREQKTKSQKTKSTTSAEPVNTGTMPAASGLKTLTDNPGLNSVVAASAGQSVQTAAALPTGVTRAGTGIKGVAGSGSSSAARRTVSAESMDSGASQAAGRSTALAVEGQLSAQRQTGAGNTQGKAQDGAEDRVSDKAADKVQGQTQSAGIEPGASARSGKEKTVSPGPSKSGMPSAAVGKTTFSIGSAANGNVSASQGHEGSVLSVTGVHSGTGEVTTGRSTAESSDPFHRLDQPTGVEMGTMVLHRGPQSVAVGVRDPGLGWTEIHAESTAGQVSAVVATASTAAHASLASHLPSLTQFLSDHNVQVGSVTVEHGLRGGADGYTGNDRNGPGSNPGGGMAQPGASQQEQAQSSAGQRADVREMQTSGGASGEAAGGVFAGGGGSRVHVIA